MLFELTINLRVKITMLIVKIVTSAIEWLKLALKNKQHKIFDKWLRLSKRWCLSRTSLEPWPIRWCVRDKKHNHSVQQRITLVLYWWIKTRGTFKANNQNLGYWIRAMEYIIALYCWSRTLYIARTPTHQNNAHAINNEHR